MTAPPPRLAAPIRVAIADDHPILRRSLRSHLDTLADIEVVGEAATGRQAVDLVRTQRPDVLLLDVDMPGFSGFDALAKIRSRAPQVRVLMLSEDADQACGTTLLRHGASGHLHKAADPAEFEAAIRRVAAGRPWVPQQLAQQLLEEALRPQASAHQQLSRRELQVLLKLARGRRTNEVATELSLSPKTVATHRARLMRKLGARTCSDLTYYAVKHRLVE